MTLLLYAQREYASSAYLAQQLDQNLGVLIYGDTEYGINDLLCCPFRNNYVNSAEKCFNVIMSKSRVSIE
jgi:hypothetical protein